MDTVYLAGGDDGSGVEKGAGEIGSDLLVGGGQSGTALIGTLEFWGIESARSANGRRANDQNGRNGHLRLDRSFADLVYERSDALCGRPGIVVWMRELKVVGAEHEDDEREGRIDLDALGEAFASVASELERVVPNGAASVEAVFDDADFPITGVKRVFENAGPAVVEGEALASAGDDAPGEGVGVEEELMHWFHLLNYQKLNTETQRHRGRIGEGPGLALGVPWTGRGISSLPFLEMTNRKRTFKHVTSRIPILASN